jgi:heavy metal translocating P-type ATPase
MTEAASEPAPPRLSWREATYRFPPLRNALLSGLLLAVGLILEGADAPEGLAIAAFAVGIVVGARYFAAEGLEELVSEREVGIEILMLLAAAGAIVFGLVEEAAALVFLYATAEAVEELTFARTRSAIRDLLDLAPKQATRLRDGREEVVAAEELRPGDRFLVRPGESLPTDGVIREGRGALDEAAVTGEAVPVERGPGQEVFAGSVNGQSALEIEATRAFEDNTLQRIVHLVEEAQAQKSRTQRFVDRFSLRYSPAVIVAAVIVALVPPLLGGDWEEWALRAVTLLVAAAPCALVMSVPVAAAAAISRAGREGILIKGGAQLEGLARIDAVCFDKTGTLTRGVPEVTDVIALRGEERDVLALAAGVESASEHPLARAIVAHARERGIEPPQAGGFQALVGHGARARVAGEEAWIGSPQMLSEVAPDSELPDAVGSLQDEGKTVTLVGRGDEPFGVLALRDEPRANAREAIERLHALGVRRVLMLSGDNRRTAKAIASELGLDEVLAELKPEDKVREVERLSAEHAAVAMVGDGINDAPALAVADVGIAMGTGGTDAAIEAADVALMADDITKVAEALRIGRRAGRISRQNLIFSVLLLSVLIPSAVVGLLTVVVAVLVHEVSELLAVGNGVRAAQRPAPAPQPA